MFWKPSIAPAAVGYAVPVPGGDTTAPHIDADDLTVIGTQDGLMYVRLATGALLVLDAKNLHRPLGILVPLDEHWTARINSLESLRAQLLHHKRSPPPLTSQQRRRIQLALRTLDARRDRASYQTIAGHLFGAEAVSREHWKTSSLKAQITRLTAHGTHLTTKGYRFLLLGKGPTGRSTPRKRSPRDLRKSNPHQSLILLAFGGDVFAQRSSSSLPMALFRFDDLRQPATRRRAA